MNGNLLFIDKSVPIQLTYPVNYMYGKSEIMRENALGLYRSVIFFLWGLFASMLSHFARERERSQQWAEKNLYCIPP